MPSAAGMLAVFRAMRQRHRFVWKWKTFFALLSRFARCCFAYLTWACFVITLALSPTTHANFIPSFKTQAEPPSRLLSPSIRSIYDPWNFSTFLILGISLQLSITSYWIRKGLYSQRFTDTHNKSRVSRDSFPLYRWLFLHGTHSYKIQKSFAFLNYLFPDFHIPQHITSSQQIPVSPLPFPTLSPFHPSQQIIHHG